MESGAASRTAVFVCQGRAAADGLIAVGTFADPVAAQLLSSDELEVVRLARSRVAPSQGQQRFAFESVRACAEVVAPRTVAVDRVLADAVRPDRRPQVVLLGAGLDSRPWRLPDLAGATVFAVDHPASQSDARRRAASLTHPACDLRHVPVDLAAEALAPALAAAGHDADRPTVWVWEGVVPYLTTSQVTATVEAVAAASAPGSTLALTYQERSLTASVGRVLMGLMARVSGAERVLADEPWKSAWTPVGLEHLLTGRGWIVESDQRLLDVALAIGSPTRRRRSLRNGRVAVAHRSATAPMQA